MKWILLSALAVFAIYVGLCILLYAKQDRLLYFPTPESNPAGATALRIRSGDAVLKVWQLHADADAALIYFGGNAEDVAADLPNFDAGFADRAVLLVNYRGYGGSTGTPSEAALVADAQAIYDVIHVQHRQISVMGRSLGSGIATALAATRPVEKLILATPYDSIANVAADHFAWFPVRWLVRDRFDSVDRMKDVRAPVLVVIAERDEVIFRPRSDALLAATPPSQVHVRVIAGATHNDIDQHAEYFKSASEFLKPQ
jgi:hypothetical protein